MWYAAGVAITTNSAYIFLISDTFREDYTMHFRFWMWEWAFELQQPNCVCQVLLCGASCLRGANLLQIVFWLSTYWVEGADGDCFCYQGGGALRKIYIIDWHFFAYTGKKKTGSWSFVITLRRQNGNHHGTPAQETEVRKAFQELMKVLILFSQEYQVLCGVHQRRQIQVSSLWRNETWRPASCKL